MARSRIIAGKAVIIIEAQNLVDKTLGKIRGNLHRFSNEMGKVGESLFRTGFFGAIASGVTVNAFVKFDDAMRTLRVNLDLFGKTAKQVEAVMGPLEERIRSLAKTTPFSPTEVAGAATELAKGGFQPEQIKESLQAVLDLSRATKSELGTSAEFVVRTMTTFGIATDKASEVVSQLVRASRKGTLGIDDLEAALRFSSGTADTLGVSLQKMLAIFTVLSNRGLVGSIAGTSTNTALAQLVKKAEELRDIGAIELVTGVREDGQEALDLIKTLENLFRYAETLPFVQQQTLFQDIFNLRGSRSITAIRKEMETIKNLTGFISDAGDEAAVAAKIMDDGIGGSLRRLFSTLQDVGIALGETVEQPIIRIASVIKGLLTELGKVAALNPALTSLVILSPGILLAASVGMIALAKGLRIAAYSAGLLKGALGPVLRTISQGTVGQISAVSNLANNARRRRTTPRFSPARETTSRMAAARETTTAQRALIAQNQRNAALGIQRQASAEKLLAVAERNRISSQAKLTAARNNTTKSISAQKAVLDQNTRSLDLNLKAQKDNALNIIINKGYQQSIDNLQKESYAIQERLSKTRVLRSPKGGLREVPNLPTAELRRLTNDRERIAHQIRRLKEEQVKLGVVDQLKLQTRQKALLAERATALNKVMQLEKTASALGKGKVAIENRYIKQLTKGQDLLLDANKARQSITTVDIAKKSPLNFQRGINAGLTAIKNFKFASLSKSVLAFGKTLQTVFTGIRRVFSTTGLLTVVEVLILFGDKIPIVNTALSGLGSAFGAAFKQIGDIAKFAVGPIELLKASIAAFQQDRSDLGIEGLKRAFFSLVDIIGNQLYAAWNKFKEGIAPVYDFIVGLFNVIDLTIRSMVESIATGIGSLISTLGQSFKPIFGQTEIGGGSTLNAISSIAEAIAKLIPSLFNWIAQLTVAFNSFIQQFIVKLEYALTRANPYTTTTAENTDARLKEIRSEAALKQKLLQKDLEATTAGISKAFTASSAEISRENASKAIAASTQQRNQSLLDAQFIIRELRKQVATPTPPGGAGNFPQEITQQNPTQHPLVIAMQTIADTLVGSAQSTRGNVLRAGKEIDKQQLEEQKKANEYLRKMAEERGIRFAP